jgi:hypothetical protein
MSLNRNFLNEIFLDQYPKSNRMPKNLRHNAREAAEYLTNIPYTDNAGSMEPVIGRAGRSSGTNN